MDSLSRHGDIADGKNFKCELYFSFLIPKVNIRNSQSASEIIQNHVSARQTDVATSLSIRIFQILLARDFVRLTWLISMIPLFVICRHIGLILRVYLQ
jgi:hypothetical protein